MSNNETTASETLSLPESESLVANSQEHELFEDASARSYELKFEVDNDAVDDTLSLPEAESSATSSQERELFKNASAREKPEGDTIKSVPSSDTPSVDLPGSEAGAVTAEWSDANTDTYLSGTPSSSAPSSPPRFDEDATEAAVPQPESTELQI